MFRARLGGVRVMVETDPDPDDAEVVGPVSLLEAHPVELWHGRAVAEDD